MKSPQNMPFKFENRITGHEHHSRVHSIQIAECVSYASKYLNTYQTLEPYDVAYIRLIRDLEVAGQATWSCVQNDILVTAYFSNVLENDHEKASDGEQTGKSKCPD